MRTRALAVCGLTVVLAGPAHALDLLSRYPTTLTAGDDAPDRARPWEFTDADIFRVTGFRFEAGRHLRIEVNGGDVGVAHCPDGAVWAVLIPRAGGKLRSSASTNEESIAHLWLRFHPREINRLFPPETVFRDGQTGLASQMRIIAGSKFTSSWHAGMNAMIPEPNILTVDADTSGGPRRFFAVDTKAQTAEYIPAFEKRSVKAPPPITAALAEEAFDKLWDAFDRDYAMFVLRPEVDWTGLREQYRPKALAAGSAYELAGVFAQMLKPLRDLHIWLKVAGADVPVFNRPRSANANPAAHRRILGNLNDAGRNVKWAVTPDKVGFVAIYAWNSPDVPAECQQVLEEMRDTRGLIVDVRLNGGGSEDQARLFAGRFLAKKFVYAYSQFRHGPAHTNLTEKFERVVAPRGPWRYNRPVVLLIGQKCMSSNESFIAMMSGDPDLTTMGDHTCGSSGNPRMVELPLDITVSVPRWIDYLPDGSPLDERGFQPQVEFKPAPGAFEGERDDLLSAALERLRALPLPSQPIEGPAFASKATDAALRPQQSAADLPDHSADVKAEAADPSRPRVVSITPEADAKEVALTTQLRIRFDRPMDPLSFKLAWESGGCCDCGFPEYNPTRCEFTVPVQLAPGALHQVVVNPPFIRQDLSEARKQWPLDGFRSEDHQLAGIFVWRFRTRDARSPADSKPPKVTSIFPAANSEVARLTFAEIQFDQPMAPPEESFPFLVSPAGAAQAAALLPHVHYDPVKHLFRIPLVLPPKGEVRFSLAGLRSAGGVTAEPIKLQYRVTNDEFAKADRARIEQAAREKPLLDLLASMKQQREQLTSLTERVQTISLRHENGLIIGLEANSASFKWQKPDRFYADASQPMLSCTAFRIGCDGQNWWWHFAGRKEQLVVCPVGDMHTLNVRLCDPFGLTSQTPAAAASEANLAYAGKASIGGANYHVVESWGSDSLTRWLIDPQSFRPVEMHTYYAFGIWRTRFLYDTVNAALPAEAFAVPKLDGVPATPPEALDQDYNNRFVNVCDGSDGRMSVRWGKTGPKGRSSSGLN